VTKGTKQNHKLKIIIIISVILHLLLIALLILGSLTKNTNINTYPSANRTVIDVAMVNPSTVTQQYQHQEQEYTKGKRIQQQYKKITEKQTEDLKQKQMIEHQRLKDLEKEPMQTQKNTKQVAEEQQKQLSKKQKITITETKKTQQIEQKQLKDSQTKAENNKILKATTKVREKAIVITKKVTIATAKKQAEEKKIENKVKQKTATKIKKITILSEAKKKAIAEKIMVTEINNLLGSLAAERNTLQGSAAKISQDINRNNNASGSEINKYLGQITAAIQSKFYDANLYHGHKCNLRIQLSPEAMLIDITTEEGDSALCQAAMSAAKQAKIPKLPNNNVYQVFKNVTLIFKP